MAKDNTTDYRSLTTDQRKIVYKNYVEFLQTLDKKELENKYCLKWEGSLTFEKVVRYLPYITKQ